MEPRRGLLLIAALDLLLMTIGITGAVGVKRFLGHLSPEEAQALGPGFWAGGHLGYLSLALVAVAIITFFGMLALERSSRTVEAASERTMRQAIRSL
jgi:hypothetical protein